MASSKKVFNGVTKILYKLKFDSNKCVIKGEHRGYSVFVKRNSAFENKQAAYVYFSVKNVDQPERIAMLSELSHELLSGSKIDKASLEGYTVKIYVPFGRITKTSTDKIIETINNAANLFVKYGAINCDAEGTPGETSPYLILDECVFYGEEAAAKVAQKLKATKTAASAIQENVLLGTIFAILGALVGSLVIFLVARIGYVLTVSSVVMGFTVVYGYKWKGKRFSTVSAVICFCISTLFTYLTFRLDMAISIYLSLKSAMLNSSFEYCFVNSKEIMIQADKLSTYYSNMILLMLAGILSVVVLAGKELKAHKEAYELKKA